MNDNKFSAEEMAIANSDLDGMNGIGGVAGGFADELSVQQNEDQGSIGMLMDIVTDLSAEIQTLKEQVAQLSGASNGQASEPVSSVQPTQPQQPDILSSILMANANAQNKGGGQ